VDEHGKKIKGIFSVLAHPFTVRRARNAGIKIHWLHSLFDNDEGKKSFNQISALMVRAKNQFHKLPAIQTGGNVGTSCWFIGWRILKCKTVCLIGINHGWEEDDPLETIITHGNTGKPPNVKINSPKFNRLFPKIYNPDFKTYCILDPIFQNYRTVFKEFIARSHTKVNTINSTEGGSIFGDKITSMPLKEFLKKFKN